MTTSRTTLVRIFATETQMKWLYSDEFAIRINEKESTCARENSKRNYVSSSTTTTTSAPTSHSVRHYDRWSWFVMMGQRAPVQQETTNSGGNAREIDGLESFSILVCCVVPHTRESSTSIDPTNNNNRSPITIEPTRRAVHSQQVICEYFSLAKIKMIVIANQRL